MHYYTDAFKKYAVFQGRSTRREFWMFLLINMIISIVLSTFLDGGQGLISNLYLLITVLPSLAMGVRRLHDTNRSGWWLFMNLLPIIGQITLLVFFASKGTAGENQYGSESGATMVAAAV
jgi:uncharacterized membrane protein YhaH (DUF805 family)